MLMKRFPEGFYFGAATSSHQVEGGCLNDWSEWEKRNASRLAEEHIAGGPGSKLPQSAGGEIPENYISGKAVDHYNRYEEDFSLAAEIGLNAYRFSVEWSRIEPDEGIWDEEEIKHYSDMISSLRKKNIEPFVTVWHWTLPLWLAKTGGIMNPRFPYLFSRYASKLAVSFGDDVKFYITVNEPEIYSLNSYMLGKWPPQKRGIISYFRAVNILIKAHRLAYREIKKEIPESSIGPACNMTFFESGGGFTNRVAVLAAEYFWNRYFMDRVKGDTDFIGVNYYFHNRIRYGLNKNQNEKVSDMGWELYPQGIGPVIEKLKSYGLPVYITESGLADAEERYRGWLIGETLKEIYYSIQAGADVRGYFHWSLMDNFEWDKGFWPKFGLISVDRNTMKRSIRGSAKIYSSIIKKGLDI